MTTIAALNVRLGMDASAFSQGVDLARNEVAKVQRIMRDSVPPATRLQESLKLLDRTFSESGKKTKEYAAAVQHLKDKYSDLGKTVATQDSLISGVKRLAAAWLGFQTARTIVGIASDLESAAIQFEVLTGSAEAANKMMEEMRTFAAASPLSLSGVQKAGQVLMSFGTDADKVMQKIALLGDITGGNQLRFESLTLAYAQASAAGRLMGQDLLQMVNAGFNPLLEISEATGRSISDLKKDMEKGLITIDMVDAAFARATGEGGRFNGMTDRLGKTFAGSVAQMKSAASELAGTLGAVLIPPLTKVMQVTEKLIRSVMLAWESMSNLGKSVTMGTIAFAASLPVIAQVIGVLRTIISTLRLVAAGQATVLAFSGPAGWAALAVGIGVATAAYYSLSVAASQAEQSVRGSAMAGTEMGKIADGFAASMEAAAARTREAFAATDMGKLAASVDAAGKAAIERSAAEVAALQAASKASAAHSETLQNLMMQRLELKYSEEEYAKIQDRMRGMDELQVEQLANVREEIALLKQKKKEQDDFVQLQDDATRAAQAFFAAEKRADEERIKRMIEGPKAIEAGSAEAARLVAEAHNRALAQKEVGKKDPTEDEFNQKVKELLIADIEQRKKQEELLKQMRVATATMLETRPKLAR